MSENYDLRPNTYVDRKDGLTKSFTVIDHSKKAKVFYEDPTPSDYNHEDARLTLIKKILKYPAVLCPKDMIHLLKRGEGQSVILWNEDLLHNLDWVGLYSVLTICSNGWKFHKEYNPLINIEAEEE